MSPEGWCLDCIKNSGKKNSARASTMKKITQILITLTTLCLIGCGADPNMPKETGPQATGYTTARTVHHFDYKNHKYIQFEQGNCQSITHDPDCPCTKKAEK